MAEKKKDPLSRILFLFTTHPDSILLLRLLNEIPGVSLPDDCIEKFPSIPLSTLTREGSLEKLLAAVEWTNEQVARQPK